MVRTLHGRGEGQIKRRGKPPPRVNPQRCTFYLYIVDMTDTSFIGPPPHRAPGPKVSIKFRRIPLRPSVHTLITRLEHRLAPRPSKPRKHKDRLPPLRRPLLLRLCRRQ